MHVASIYVLIPVQNIAETIAGLYFALYSAAVFCTGMSTYVGNEWVRGVSGGEKKRVSVAEMLAAKACKLFLCFSSPSC